MKKRFLPSLPHKIAATILFLFASISSVPALAEPPTPFPNLIPDWSRPAGSGSESAIYEMNLNGNTVAVRRDLPGIYNSSERTANIARRLEAMGVGARFHGWTPLMGPDGLVKPAYISERIPAGTFSRGQVTWQNLFEGIKKTAYADKPMLYTDLWSNALGRNGNLLLLDIGEWSVYDAQNADEVLDYWENQLGNWRNLSASDIQGSGLTSMNQSDMIKLHEAIIVERRGRYELDLPTPTTDEALIEMPESSSGANDIKLHRQGRAMRIFRLGTRVVGVSLAVFEVANGAYYAYNFDGDLGAKLVAGVNMATEVPYGVELADTFDYWLLNNPAPGELSSGLETMHTWFESVLKSESIGAELLDLTQKVEKSTRDLQRFDDGEILHLTIPSALPLFFNDKFYIFNDAGDKENFYKEIDRNTGLFIGEKIRVSQPRTFLDNRLKAAEDKLVNKLKQLPESPAPSEEAEPLQEELDSGSYFDYDPDDDSDDDSDYDSDYDPDYGSYFDYDPGL